MFFARYNYTQGVKYLFVPDWSKLADLNVWRAAAGQVQYRPQCVVSSGRSGTVQTSMCGVQRPVRYSTDLSTGEFFFMKLVLLNC